MQADVILKEPPPLVRPWTLLQVKLKLINLVTHVVLLFILVTYLYFHAAEQCNCA